MINKYNSLVVNLFGGSGVGKSTNAYLIAGLLKLRGIECEYISEWVKDMVFEDRKDIFDCQMYVTAKQLHKIHRVNNKTQVIIVDSPIILGIIFDKDKDEDFKRYVIKQFNKFNNYNIFLQRADKIFSQNGRNENLQEAKNIDVKLESLLLENEIPYIKEKGGLENGKKIVEDIISRLIVDKIYNK